MDQEGIGRRTRNRFSTVGGIEAKPPNDESSSNESEARASRSSRLKNPEFAAKHKAFMAKVTAATKGSMDTYLTNEIISETTPCPGGKRKATTKIHDDQVKRRRTTRSKSYGTEMQSDSYCWICHKEGEFICCETCPRVYHSRCLQLDNSPEEDWVCPECVLIMTAENMSSRSRAMRLLTIDQLCTLLKHAINRMKSVSNVEPFMKPVDHLQFPAYKDYISNPMDLQTIERNIRKKIYGSTEAMLADCKWILHNCIIFNSPSSKLTHIAKSIVNVCKYEMQEIENCPDCYLNAHVKKDIWFTEACRLPHPLVWAKLKGFPYWPGKLMRSNSENLGDVRFFGAHDRAWIPMKDIFLYSEKTPIEVKKKRGNIEDSFNEVKKHMNKLEEKFGRVEFAKHRTPYDQTRELEMLNILLPNYAPPFDIGVVGRRNLSCSTTENEKCSGDVAKPAENLESVVEEEDMISVSTEEAESHKVLPIKVKINAKLATVLRDPEPDVCSNIDEVRSIEKNAVKGGETEVDMVSPEEKNADANEKPSVIENEIADDTRNVSSHEDKQDASSYVPTSDNLKSNDDAFVSSVLNSENEETNRKLDGIVSEGFDERQDIMDKDLLSENVDNSERSSIRSTTSPPCEVTSTTLTNSVLTIEASDKKLSEESEGFLVDSNNKKIIIEGAPEEEAKTGELQPDVTVKTGTGDESKAEREEKTKDLESENNKDLIENPLNLLGTDVSLTIVKTPNKKEKEAGKKDLVGEERKLQVMSPDQNLVSDCHEKEVAPSSSKESEVTISRVNKVSAVGDTGRKQPSSSPPKSQQIRRLSHSSSPVAQSSPPFFPRFPGARPNMHHVGYMPMLGPSRMLLRAPSMSFRQNRPSQPSPGPLNLPPNLPSTAGPVADQLNKVANKLADSLKRHFVDSLSETTANLDESPQTAIKRMKIEIERAEWRHQQEMVEMKHNAELVIREMRQVMESEKQKAFVDCKKQFEIEKQAAINEAKKKQWCAHCGKEAIFYCCWNTSYCDYPCQQAHWPTHMNTCAQNASRSEEETVLPDHVLAQQEYVQQQNHIGTVERHSRHTVMMGGGMRMLRPSNRLGPTGHVSVYSRPYFM